MEYNILEPRVKSEKPPLLVMLHGYGSDHNDLFSFAHLLSNKLLIISAKAPIALPWGGNAWYEIDFNADDGSRFGNVDQALNAVHLVADFIKDIAEKYQTNPAETHILGFSQGAILSYALSMHYPNLVKNVMAMSGYVFEEIMPLKPVPEAIAHLDFFASHGTLDEVIPIDWARKARFWLEQNGLKHRYTEYNMGHGINENCFTDLQNWLNERI